VSTQDADIFNMVLDEIGHPADKRIGDLQEGSAEAKVGLRHYGTSLRQILRAAHWNFSRFRAEMTLLNDSTGNTTRQQMTEGVPVTVGAGTPGMRPWIFSYAWPVDCVKARFVPATRHPFGGTGIPPGNIAIPPNPLMSGLNEGQFHHQRPTRFVVSSDSIPNLTGAVTDWSQLPDTSRTMGQGLTSQTVILSNQPRAELVYTRLIIYPDQWDPLFRQAFVAYLASQTVMALTTDRKLGVSIRQEQIAVAKMALEQARIRDGDEGWPNIDREASWIRARIVGPWSGSGFGFNGQGVLGYSWETCGFSDGSAY
jgi:hypothetical protein